jgi:hypothetical protein
MRIAILFLFLNIPFELFSEEANCEKIFTEIWKTWAWKGEYSASGAGSDLQQTAVIREKIPELLEQYHCKSIADAPCGDFYWLQTVDLPVEKYFGIDVVAPMIEALQEEFGNCQRSFLLKDLTKEIIPRVDLVLCRDCLIHLSYKDIKKVIFLLKLSGSKYLLTTSFVNRESNYDIPTGEWHPINLLKPPFNFPPPLEIINENCSEDDGKWSDKSLLLWKLSNL